MVTIWRSGFIMHSGFLLLMSCRSPASTESAFQNFVEKLKSSCPEVTTVAE